MRARNPRSGPTGAGLGVGFGDSSEWLGPSSIGAGPNLLVAPGLTITADDTDRTESEAVSPSPAAPISKEWIAFD